MTRPGPNASSTVIFKLSLSVCILPAMHAFVTAPPPVSCVCVSLCVCVSRSIGSAAAPLSRDDHRSEE